ncbi:prolyl 4-hydroxylase [Pseudoscourfieldia marina]
MPASMSSTTKSQAHRFLRSQYNARPLPSFSAAATSSTSPSAQPTGPSSGGGGRPILRLQKSVVAEGQGGLVLGRETNESLRNLRNLLSQDYLDVNLTLFPSIRLLNIDPPVLVIDDFLNADLCERLIQDTTESGQLQQSRVGGDDTMDDARTSRTLTLTAGKFEEHPAKVEAQRQVAQLLPELKHLPADPLRYQRPTKPGTYAFELPQVAHYKKGDYFRLHEDAFPYAVASEQKSYQRRATLLVYLNDVEGGGATTFHHVELAVKPKAGMALLFFPSFRNGRPDPRTLHEAEEPTDGDKYIMQLWIAGAVDKNAVPATPVASTQAQTKPKVKTTPAKKKKKTAAPKRGFGV